MAYRHNLPDGSTGMKNRLGKFASIGVSDTAHMIRFAALNLPDEEPAELYKLLASSYAGMMKKFTSGGPRVDLDSALDSIQKSPTKLAGHVLRVENTIRTLPSVKKAGLEILEPEKLESYRANATHLGESPSALCPASVEVKPGEMTAAEKVWKWTVEVAKNSGLIERIREVEAA